MMVISPQEGELCTNPSTKLARAQLPQRRSNSSSKRTPSVAAHLSRIGKPSSRHNSPKSIEKLKTATAIQQWSYMDDSHASTSAMPRVDRLDRVKMERPFSWHPTSNTCFDNSFASSSALPTTSGSEFAPAWPLSNDWPQESHYSYLQVLTQPHTDYSTTSNLPTYDYLGPVNSDVQPTIPSYPSWNQVSPNDTAPTARWSAYDTDVERYAPPPYRLSSDFESILTPPLYQQPTQLPFQPLQPVQLSSVAQAAPIWNPNYEQQLAFSKEYCAPKDEEELIGLGLYDNAEAISPTQMHPPLPQISRGVVVNLGKGLKLEETWQPPRDWTSIDSPAESEGSTSPEDQNLTYPPLAQEAAIVRYEPAPQYGIPDNNLYFENDAFRTDWVPEELKIPQQTLGYGGYGWTGGRVQSSYV